MKTTTNYKFNVSKMQNLTADLALLSNLDIIFLGLYQKWRLVFLIRTADHFLDTVDIVRLSN